jgi:hypothetical protein
LGHKAGEWNTRISQYVNRHVGFPTLGEGAVDVSDNLDAAVILHEWRDIAEEDDHHRAV